MSYEKLEVTKGLMEVYTAMYASQEEVVGDTVEQLNEAPMTAFQAAGGQARLDQINRGRGPRQGRATAADLERKGQDILYKAGGGDAAIRQGPQRNAGRGGMQPTLTRQDIINRGTVAAAKPTKPQVSNIPPAEGTGRGGPSDIRRTSTPTASTTPARPAAPAATKTAPAAPAGQTGDKAKDMATWAKANPKLAAAAAERDRTRGTSATTNPLMKDFKDRLPAPKAPSPTTASTAFKSSTPSLGSSSSSVQSAGSAAGAKAFPVKPVTSAQATAATTKPVAPEVKATNTAAAAPKPVTANPSAATKPASAPKRDEPLFEDSVDIFDVVIEYLVAEGYADTNQAALVIMANMSEEWREEILEAKYGTAAGRKALAKKIRKGENIGKKGPGTGFKAVENAAEKGGAEDPTAVAAAAMYKTYGGKKG